MRYHSPLPTSFGRTPEELYSSYLQAVEALEHNTDDNATSLIESISTALSQLELNRVGRISSLAKEDESDEDNLERMVDVLFRNVRSLKSLLQPLPATTDTSSTSPNSDDKDDTSELTKLIEIMTSSHRVSGANTHEATVSSEGALEEYKFRGDEEHVHQYGMRGDVHQYNLYAIAGEEHQYGIGGDVQYNAIGGDVQYNQYDTEYSQHDAGAQWSGSGKQRKQKQFSDESEQDDTSHSDYTDPDYRSELTGSQHSTTTEETTDSILLKYGYIPVQDVALYPTLSQCDTDSTDNELDRSVQLFSDDDSLIVSEVSLGMPQHELGSSKPSSSLNPSRKDVLDMYNKLLNDMSSLSNMIHQDSSSKATDSTFNNDFSPKQLKTGDTISSLLTTNHDLSNITNRVNKTTEPMKEAAEIIELLSGGLGKVHRPHQLTSDSGEGSGSPGYLSDLLQEVDNVATRIGQAASTALLEESPLARPRTAQHRLTKPPPSAIFTPSSDETEHTPEAPRQLSPGQIEWDDFTPLINTPDATRNTSESSYIPCLSDNETYYEETSLSDMYVPHLECTVETIPSEHFSNLLAVLGSKEKLYEDSRPYNSPPELNSSFTESESLSEDFHTDPEYWEPEFKLSRRRVSGSSEVVGRCSKGSTSDDVTLPSVASLLDKARQSSSSRVISIGTHSLNMEAPSEHIEVFTTHPTEPRPPENNRPAEVPAVKDELPAYLKLFLKPDESPDYIPNTALLNALLAPCGLTITPIQQPEPLVKQRPEPIVEDYDDHTSHISEASDNKSLPSLGYRPPKLQSYADDNTKDASTMTQPIDEVPAVTKDHPPTVGPDTETPRAEQVAKDTPSPPAPPAAESPRSITPEVMYNIPPPAPPSALLIDTWTCTTPLPAVCHAATETGLCSTEDRAVSPIGVYEGAKPGFTTATTRKRVTSSDYDEVPRGDIPAIRRRSSDSSLFSSVSSVNLDLSMVPEEKPAVIEKADAAPQTDAIPTASPEPVERIPTPTSNPPPPSDQPRPSKWSKVPKHKPTKKHELQKALLRALVKRPENKTININTLKGIRSQLERQSSELLSARSRLANAGDRMRSKLEMFDVERLDESVLEENM